MENLHTALKEQTQEAHLQLHRLPILSAIVEGKITEDQYQALVSRYYSIYESIEDAILQYTLDNPIDYTVIYKKNWLAEDLKGLPEALEFFEINCVEELLGVLYVIEGSSLGNQFLIKKLEPILGASCSLRFFYGYGESTQARWKNFLSFLDSFTDLNRELVINSAKNTFSYYYKFLGDLQ